LGGLEIGASVMLRAVQTAAMLAVLTRPATMGRADDKASFESRYTKHEYRIPMRDGVKLFTLVYTPKDRETNYPVLLQRTPYDLKPYTVDAAGKPGYLPDSYVNEGFIFALQDVRGRFGSEGVFVDERPFKEGKAGPKDVDETSDTFDTIDWLVKHVPGNNGNVGMTGISYLGFYAAAGMIDGHPALKAVSPQAPCVDLFDGDDTLHGGGFWLAHNFGFYQSFGQKLTDPTRQEPTPFDFKTPDGYRFFLEGGSIGDLTAKYFVGHDPFWADQLDHLQDAGWCRERDMSLHLKNVRAAVLTVGGWYDAEDLHGALKTYRMTESGNPGIYNGLVMGPWFHGGWHGGDGEALGSIQFQSKTAAYFRDQIEVPFFRKYLKGDTNVALPEAWVFATGVNEWRKESAWPPAAAKPKSLYFQAGGRLSFNADAGSGDAFDEYVSDPARPVPFTARISTGMPREYMVEDQRFAATRPDVLVYVSEPLDEDVAVAGPVSPKLNVSTTGGDADWVVKLIDVHTGDAPDPEPNPRDVRMGHYQQLVRGEPFRGKFREGYGNPKPFEAGKPARVEYVMPDVYHVFRTGHRIMVQVQSSWFPLLDLNPQTYCDIYHAKASDFRKATQRVYRGGATGSRVDVLVAPGS
jgi:uncharacterized protein